MLLTQNMIEHLSSEVDIYSSYTYILLNWTRSIDSADGSYEIDLENDVYKKHISCIYPETYAVIGFLPPDTTFHVRVCRTNGNKAFGVTSTHCLKPMTIRTKNMRTFDSTILTCSYLFLSLQFISIQMEFINAGLIGFN